ncbi:hypothetical protein BAY61_07395 [Prauserella marina]|uniref:Uncharacterized protein n=1 Tax=Prauserella marina TaxID=530584 RepID=A0A222VLS0_9PSEU|nr:hypothetical protein [Prauserella marina]ASR34827.1 hypothetical protein BAY61_07395 [Prauserella marina]PWV85478.1 hypothetical protein DES30_1011505 [Prauserella marina]SDC53869.1 hypothetical protein SAMN05421630_102486 [Prauserella marina]
MISSKDASSDTMDSRTYGVCPGDPEYYRPEERWSPRISNDGEFVHENPGSVANREVPTFFDHFGLGDVVEVTNSGGPPLPVWDTYGDWSLSWPDWQAGSAVH